MKTCLAFATALIAGASALVSLSAHAHGGVQWSVTVGSPGYPGYFYTPPGVVVWPQSQYIYGAPPAAFAPPPVIYVQPPARAYPPPVLYVDPYNGPRYPLRDYRDQRRHDRHDRPDWADRGHRGDPHWRR